MIIPLSEIMIRFISTKKSFIVANHRKLYKYNLNKLIMKNTSYCEREIEKIKKERDSWKETALVAGDVKVIQSIEISLKQIASGKAIPLAQL